MLRMPLDTHAEGMTCMLNGFDDAILADSADDHILSNGGRCLMVQAVDPERLLFHDAGKFGSAIQGYGVAALILAGVVIVLALGKMHDVLMECAAEVYIHQLLATANAENGLSGGDEGIEHLHFHFVTPRDDGAALFRGSLAVIFRIDILTAGQQQAVTLHHFLNGLVQIIGVDPD